MPSFIPVSHVSHVSLSWWTLCPYVVSPGRSIPPSGTKTSRPAEHKVAGVRIKNFRSGLLGVMVSDIIPFFHNLNPETVNSRIGQYHRVDDDSEYRQPFEELFPRPTRYCHLASSVTISSRVHSIVL